MTFNSRLLAASFILASLALTLAMHLGYLTGFDDAILRFPRQIEDFSILRGGAKFAQAVSDITALGGLTVLFSLTVVVCLFFIFRGDRALAVILASSVLTGWMLSASIKILVARGRPEIVPHLIPVHDASFPSGHALVSAVTYLTLGTLIAAVQERRCVKIYVMTVAISLTGLIGLSRIVLGVHFPSDVIAGWLIGAAWSMICLAVAERYILKEK